jgi:hypothetical protein
MKIQTWMLFGAILCLPALGSAQEAVLSAAQTDSKSSAPPQFDLRSARVQDVIRAAAAGAQNQLKDIEPAPDKVDLQDLPFRAPRRMHHMKCDLADCVAYTADGDALYTVPRDQYLGVNGGGTKDEWLTCQSGNDLLTTFERFDKCRGVSIGLPVQVGGTLINLPLLDF